MMSLSVQHEEAAKNAITIVNGVLSDLSTPERLAEYYDRETGYTRHAEVFGCSGGPDLQSWG